MLILFLTCFDLISQDSLTFAIPGKWIKTEFYIFTPSKDDLTEEKYTSNYSIKRNAAFKKDHGWKGEYLEIRLDTTVKMYILDRNNKYFNEEIFICRNNTLVGLHDTIKILVISKKCLVLNHGDKFYDVYSILKKRKKINFCDCVISDVIRKKFSK